ncbi:MAG TPA: hypothetical protein EYQ20_20615 [candidate division Zixibacteria bacterium]|nr:hypothetical protein [candidate division Zixibacteria bacterium]
MSSEGLFQYLIFRPGIESVDHYRACLNPIFYRRQGQYSKGPHAILLTQPLPHGFFVFGIDFLPSFLKLVDGRLAESNKRPTSLDQAFRRRRLS